MAVIPCYPKETKREMARYLRNKGRAEEREGRSGEEFYQLSHMFKHRIPDCKTEGRIHKSYLDVPIHDESEEPGQPYSYQQPGDLQNDIPLLLTMAKMDPTQHVGNVMRGLIEQQDEETLSQTYLKVAKVQNPYEIDYSGESKHECPNSKSGPVEDRYLCPETVYENPDEPHKFHTIADAIFFEDDKMKGRWKKATPVEQAGFVQVLNPEAVRGQGAKRPPVSDGRVQLPAPEPVPQEVQQLTEQIQASMPKVEKKTRKPTTAKVVACAKKTRTLAESLRNYDKAKVEQTLAEKKTELKNLKQIENTTDSNEELDRVQEEIPRVEREVKQLSKQSIDTFRKEYQELKTKCPGLTAEYYDKLGQYSNVLKFHYASDSTSVQSLVVRDDAQELLEEILKGGM